MELRPYQDLAVREIRSHFSRGNKKVLLHLATGGGKTHIFSYILKSLVSRGKKGLMVVRGRQLVDNASERLHHEGVKHGVIMAQRRESFNESVYVCSIDTLNRRDLDFDPHLIVIDEAHMAGCESYRKFAEKYNGKFFLSVTATPYQSASIEHVAEHIVYPIGIKQLIAEGWLVPPKYFAPENLDLTGVRVRGGDYVDSELAHHMMGKALVGNVVQKWKQIGQNRPTVCFAVNVEHSKQIASEFSAEGVPSEHLDANSSDTERKNALQNLQSGKIRVVTNCGILCTGVDMPYVSCIILARPTKSTNLFIQQVGRGTRPCSGKTDFIVLDHANNLRVHGPIEYDRDASLSGKTNKKGSDEAPVKTCPECFAVVSIALQKCEECGHKFNMEKIEKQIVETELKSYTAETFQKNEIIDLCMTCVKRKYKPGWVFHQLSKKYGENSSQKMIPPPWRMQELIRRLSIAYYSQSQNSNDAEHGSTIRVLQKQIEGKSYPSD